MFGSMHILSPCCPFGASGVSGNDVGVFKLLWLKQSSGLSAPPSVHPCLYGPSPCFHFGNSILQLRRINSTSNEVFAILPLINTWYTVAIYSKPNLKESSKEHKHHWRTPFSNLYRLRKLRLGLHLFLMYI